MSTQRDLSRVRIIFAHVEPCLHMPTQLRNKFALLFAFLQFVNLFNCWKSAVIWCQGFCCFPNTFYTCQPTTRLIDTCGCYTWIWRAGGNVNFEIFQSGVYLSMGHGPCAIDLTTCVTHNPFHWPHLTWGDEFTKKIWEILHLGFTGLRLSNHSVCLRTYSLSIHQRRVHPCDFHKAMMLWKEEEK